MQKICEEKKRCRMGGERFVMAVSIVFLLAFGCCADSDRTISVFAGIDVLGKQTNKAVKVELPAAFGPFREATSFADEKGCVKGGLGGAPAAAGLGSSLTIEIRKGDGAAADGIILCDGHEVRRNDLDTRLREISRKSKKAPIVINAAAGSPHKTLVDVLDLCYRHELFSVSILTL